MQVMAHLLLHAEDVEDVKDDHNECCWKMNCWASFFVQLTLYCPRGHWNIFGISIPPEGMFVWFPMRQQMHLCDAHVTWCQQLLERSNYHKRTTLGIGERRSRAMKTQPLTTLQQTQTWHQQIGGNLLKRTQNFLPTINLFLKASLKYHKHDLNVCHSKLSISKKWQHCLICQNARTRWKTFNNPT